MQTIIIVTITFIINISSFRNLNGWLFAFQSIVFVLIPQLFYIFPNWGKGVLHAMQ